METSEIVKNFEEAAQKQGEYIEKGNIKKANKYMDRVVLEYEKLKKEGKIKELIPLMKSENPYVQLRSSAYLLQIGDCQEEAETLMGELYEKGGGVFAVTAKFALRRWKKGEADWF